MWLPSYDREAQEGHDGCRTQRDILRGPQEAVDESPHKGRVETELWKNQPVKRETLRHVIILTVVLTNTVFLVISLA